LYDVQLINRVGWDGIIRRPDPNELGWKDTVRISPLEDTIVAFRPVLPKSPFGVPDSIRPLNPMMPIGSTAMFNSTDANGNAITPPISNQIVNFGWEYVWHCHILSHEEMDMMRPVSVNAARALATAPELRATGTPGEPVQLAWTDGTPVTTDPATWGDMSAEIGYRIERAAGAGEFVEIGSALANATSFTDSNTVAGTDYQYRVVAFNAAGDAQSNVATTGLTRKAPPPDFNGDGSTDIAVFRQSEGMWYINGQPSVMWGAFGDAPVADDYNGDGSTDIAVFRPSEGMWYIEGQPAVMWGGPGDVPMPGDYNSDGSTDIAVFRPSEGMWYIQGQPAVMWGAMNDIPVPADYNGDGSTDIAVFRPSEGMWYIQGQPSVMWGNPDDLPVPADYNGDGSTDIAVFRPSEGMWYIQGQPSVMWGGPGDAPVPGDYNGDGSADIAVFRPSEGMWYIQGQPFVMWGAEGDIPLSRKP
jgi:hypothetical protein